MKKLILIAGLLLVGGYFSYIPNASSANHHNKIEITEVSTDSYNIGFPNSLKPGITQVYFLEALLELKLFRVDG